MQSILLACKVIAFSLTSCILLCVSNILTFKVYILFLCLSSILIFKLYYPEKLPHRRSGVISKTGGGVELYVRINQLRSLSHSTFQCNCLTIHIFKIRRSKLYACTSDLFLNVSVVSCRRHLNICLKCVRICFLEVL